MFNLDPGKLLVIAVVAIILLGPDRLPQVARQVGGAWKSFNQFRHRVESEVRNTVPDLPPTSEIARLARSPSALLNHLSTMSDKDEADAAEAAAAWEPGVELPDGASPPVAPHAVDAGAGAPTGDTTIGDPTISEAATGDPSDTAGGPSGTDTPPPGTEPPARSGTTDHPLPGPSLVRPVPAPAETSPHAHPTPPAGPVVPGDPTLN